MLLLLLFPIGFDEETGPPTPTPGALFPPIGNNNNNNNNLNNNNINNGINVNVHTSQYGNHRIVYDEQDKGLLIPDYIMQKYSETSMHDVLYYTAQHYSNKNHMTSNHFNGIYFGTPESNAEFPFTFSMLLS